MADPSTLHKMSFSSVPHCSEDVGLPLQHLGESDCSVSVPVDVYEASAITF
jgi:hypothetical protein